jgi:hypothetical protein
MSARTAWNAAPAAVGTKPIAQSDHRQTPPAATTGLNDRRAETQRFRDAYGKALGAKLYADGLTFEEAGEACLKHMRDEARELRDSLGLAAMKPLLDSNTQLYAESTRLPQ